MVVGDEKAKVSPYLEGEGELLCRPYCLSHSSLSFSRRSLSLYAESQCQTFANRPITNTLMPLYTCEDIH